MSFILDALKKSENERQRQVGPSLADIPHRRARADRPWWAVAVAALLVVNLGVLIVVLSRDRTGDTPPAAQQQTMQNAASAAAPQTMQPQVVSPATPAATATLPPSSPAVRSLADEAGVDGELLPSDPGMDPSVAAAGNVPEGPPVVRPISPPSVAPLANEPSFAARGRVPADEEILPTLSTLIADGTNLPEMKLDIHVYSAKPAERFVFVNMRKYVEGQALSEGPVVERITTDGAILNQQGTRFLLPRQP
jgi:general secretion pathway protein B